MGANLNPWLLAGIVSVVTWISVIIAAVSLGDPNWGIVYMVCVAVTVGLFASAARNQQLTQRR